MIEVVLFSAIQKIDGISVSVWQADKKAESAFLFTICNVTGASEDSVKLKGVSGYSAAKTSLTSVFRSSGSQSSLALDTPYFFSGKALPEGKLSPVAVDESSNEKNEKGVMTKSHTSNAHLLSGITVSYSVKLVSVGLGKSEAKATFTEATENIKLAVLSGVFLAQLQTSAHLFGSKAFDKAILQTFIPPATFSAIVINYPSPMPTPVPTQPTPAPSTMPTPSPSTVLVFVQDLVNMYMWALVGGGTLCILFGYYCHYVKKLRCFSCKKICRGCCRCNRKKVLPVDNDLDLKKKPQAITEIKTAMTVDVIKSESENVIEKSKTKPIGEPGGGNKSLPATRKNSEAEIELEV